MAAPLSDIALVNRALAKFGAGAIATMEDATSRGEAVRRVYDTVIDGLLAEHPWTFTKATQKLVEIDEEKDASGFTENGWRFVYALPGDRLGNPEKYLRDPRRQNWPVDRFELQAGRVYADDNPLWCVLRLRADLDQWPPYFVRAAVDCLAAELVMPISGNTGLLDNLQAQAWGTPQEGRRGGSLGQARQADSRAAGTYALPPDPLTTARWR